MDSILYIDKISQYNTIKDVETKHPLINVFDNSKTKALPSRQRMLFGLYAVFIKEVNCGEMQYGRNKYDYKEGSLVFIGPGQVIELDHTDDYKPKGWALIFHPDLIKGTELGKRMSQYSFFSYNLHEALHLSKKEQGIIKDLFEKLEYELDQKVDKHSKDIIVNNIELLLNYSNRFYDRQFISRENINSSVVTKFESLLNDYFHTDAPQNLGLPSVGYFADKLHLSANYFGDLIKKETGKTAQEHIQLKIMDVAKERVFETDKSVSQIAFELGFKYPQHFSRMFRKSTGYIPKDYRLMN